MKITTQQIDALFKQEELKKSASAPGADFEALLAGQMAKTTPAATDAVASGMPGALSALDPANLLAAPENKDEEAALLENSISQTALLLDAWESYAGAMKSGGQNAKGIWSQLLGMDSQVQALRGNLGQLGKGAGGLESIVNEMEVLTATEKFKFNRGEYL